MRRRIKKKLLRAVEREVANACRLYCGRPRADPKAAEWEALSRGLLQISLALVLDQWAQHGPSRLRQNAVRDVQIDIVEESPGSVRIRGAVVWSRRHKGIDTEIVERLLVDCPVPSLLKTRKSVRPSIILALAEALPSNKRLDATSAAEG